MIDHFSPRLRSLSNVLEIHHDTKFKAFEVCVAAAPNRAEVPRTVIIPQIAVREAKTIPTQAD